MNITMDSLPHKFYPFLLGHPSCPSKIKEEIDKVFEKPLVPLKSNYIFDAGKYVLKLERTDGSLTTPDTHMYRVRKAEKIRKYIVKNHLENQLMVPEKFLYWRETDRKFYVISEKVCLSDEVAKLVSDSVEILYKQGGQTLGGQIAALAANKPKRNLTPEQAKGLAELSVLGYTDLTYNNAYFTLDGKVAIIDTEPIKRSLKKIMFKNKFTWMGDKGALLSQQTISGIAKLKLYCADEKALREVETVEKKHVVWSIAKLVGKIALVCLAISFVPSVAALLPIGGILATSLSAFVITVLVVKTVSLVACAGGVAYVWKLSHDGVQGVVKIFSMEKLGVF